MSHTSASSEPTEHIRADFTWENLTYRVRLADDDESGQPRWRTLLHGLNGTARAGRTLAVMGPSGAGKTTWMSAIRGGLAVDDAHKLEGCIFMNDTVFSERYRKLLSVVAQDSILMATETPREALTFSGRVRVGMGEEDAINTADETLRRLNIVHCADKPIGQQGDLSGISNSERKRTCIGVELMSNPYAILLDEPTTGLSSVHALQIGELLRDLARDEGRTIMCTIHTPSSELFAVFDDLLLLGKGHVVYHGPRADAVAYFASIGFHVPPMTNPSEYYMNLLQLPEPELEKLWLAWEAFAASPAAADNLCILPLSTVTTSNDHFDRRAARKGATFGQEFAMLTERALRLFRRDVGATIGRAVQTIFFAILLGLFFFGVDRDMQGVQDRLGFLSLSIINAVFMAAMAGIASFPPERAVFLQEQSSESYSAFTYFLAKNIAELPFQLAFPVVAACILYFMVGLYSSAAAFFVFLVIYVLSANMGFTFGCFVAALFPSPEISMAFTPIVMLPLMLVCGFFANSDRLEPSWIWLNYISFPRYGVTGLYVNEFSRLDKICATSDTSCPYKTGEDVLKFLGFEDEKWWTSIYALVIYQLGLKVVTAFVLHLAGSSTRGKSTFTSYLRSRTASPRSLASRRNADDAAAAAAAAEAEESKEMVEASGTHADPRVPEPAAFVE